jgi:hypothetical protein
VFDSGSVQLSFSSFFTLTHLSALGSLHVHMASRPAGTNVSSFLCYVVRSCARKGLGCRFDSASVQLTFFSLFTLSQ